MAKPTDSTQRHCEAEGRMEGTCSSSLSIAVLAASANVNSSVLAKKAAYPWSKARFRKQSAQRRYGCRSSNQSKIFVVRSCVGSDLHGSNQAGSERACLHPILCIFVFTERGPETGMEQCKPPRQRIAYRSPNGWERAAKRRRFQRLTLPPYAGDLMEWRISKNGS